MSIPSRSRNSRSRIRKESTTRLRYYALSDPGRVRDNNEDAWFADPKGGLFIVADGMGGQNAGELAAKIVVTVLPVLIRERMSGMSDLTIPKAKKALVSAIKELSLQVRNKAQGQPGLDGMGATVVAALVRGRQVLIAHMGDSRAYLYRNGSLEQLTKDHTVAQLLTDSGSLTPEAARAHPARHQLTRCVGMSGEPLPEARCVPLRAGDRLLLCTDGLTGMVGDTELFLIMKQLQDMETTGKMLIAAANKAGGKDNITVLILAV